MALPISRDYTATDAGALPASTVNAIQDWIVNIYAGSVSLPINLTQNDPDFQPPLWSVTDSQGRVRDYWDAQGLISSAGVYRMDLSGIDGKITVGASSTAELIPGKLEAETGANSDISGETNVLGGGNPPSGIVMPYWQLEVSSAAAVGDRAVIRSVGSAAASGNGHVAAFQDEAITVLDVGIGLNNLTHTDIDYFIGFHQGGDVTDPEATGSNSYAMIAKRSGDANFHLLTSEATGGTSQDVDTLVAPTSAFQFREAKLEYHGLLTPLGVLNGFATVRVFLDGVLGGEIADASVPNGADGDAFGLFFCARCSVVTPLATRSLLVIPKQFSHIPYLADVSPV